MKMNLKFSALKIDEIERTFNQPIENIISDTKLNTIAIFISKGYVGEDGKIGCSKDVAFDKISEYLAQAEKNDLILDIMEELVAEGFLPKAMNVDKMREINNEKMKELDEVIEKL